MAKKKQEKKETPKRPSPSAIVRAKAQEMTVAQGVEAVLINGDLTPLTPEQRLSYYNAVCKSLGLNPLTRPFDYIAFKATENSQARLVLYARKDCTEQLRKIRRISCTNVTRKIEDGLVIAEADVVDGTGRTDHGTGVVPIHGISGRDLANAIMKAETKAKRRATLSICGLGFLDEAELDTIDDYGFVTPGGRVAFPDVPKTGSREAAQKVAEEKIAAAKVPKAIEAEKSSHIEPETASTPIPEASKEYKGTIEVDLTTESDPIVRGDVGELLELMQKHCTMEWRDDWWHCKPKDVETITAMCEQLSFKLELILPKVPSDAAMPEGKPAAQRRSAERPKPPSTPAAEPTITGKIQTVIEKMTKGSPGDPEKGIKPRASTPYMSVLLKTEDGDKWCNVFDRDLFEHISRGKGKEGTFFYTPPRDPKFGPNLVGIVRIGNREFENGKLPVIQMNDDRGKSLYE